jgi:tetratricopeptide (TPR) repeat protein
MKMNILNTIVGWLEKRLGFGPGEVLGPVLRALDKLEDRLRKRLGFEPRRIARTVQWVIDDLDAHKRQLVEKCKEYLLFWDTEIAGEYEEAVSLSDTAIDPDSINGESYGERGRCLAVLGFHLDAIDDFNRAISQGIDEADTHLGRAASRLAIGDFDGALADYEEAVRLSKTDTPHSNELNRDAKESGWPSWAAMHGDFPSKVREAKELCDKDPELWQRRKKKESSKWRRRPRAN